MNFVLFFVSLYVFYFKSCIADRASMSYEELVKDVLLEESQYLRDIHMITHVFQKSFLAGGSEICSEV
jgi:hypothetical protein